MLRSERGHRQLLQVLHRSGGERAVVQRRRHDCVDCRSPAFQAARQDSYTLTTSSPARSSLIVLPHRCICRDSPPSPLADHVLNILANTGHALAVFFAFSYAPGRYGRLFRVEQRPAQPLGRDLFAATFAQKAGWGIGAAIACWSSTASLDDYLKNAVQTASASPGIKLLGVGHLGRSQHVLRAAPDDFLRRCD